MQYMEIEGLGYEFSGWRRGSTFFFSDADVGFRDDIGIMEKNIGTTIMLLYWGDVGFGVYGAGFRD